MFRIMGEDKSNSACRGNCSDFTCGCGGTRQSIEYHIISECPLLAYRDAISDFLDSTTESNG